MANRVTMAKIELRYVQEVRRKGRRHYYFRRRGHVRVALPGIPGSPEFMDAYSASLNGKVIARSKPEAVGTVQRLVDDYYASADFSNLAASSQRTYRLVLEKFVAAHGKRIVAHLCVDKALEIIERIGAKRPGMANLTKSILQRLFKYGIKRGLRTDNPFLSVTPYRIGTHHTWTDDEMVKFEKRWPFGTRERLAYELLLGSGQRGSDVVTMKRSDIANGMIRVRPLKTRKLNQELWIPVTPRMERALKAWGARGIYLIGDDDGKPIVRQSLTLLIKKAVKGADLLGRCKAHGLRKALMRRLAEAGSSTKEIQAISGHRTLKEVERYTHDADQARLARAAAAKAWNGE